MNLSVLANALFGIIIYFNLAFLVAYYLRRNDIADIAWGPGFLVGGICAWASLPQWENQRFIFAQILIAIWAIRLAWHIGLRNLSHAQEDARYAKWRSEWGSSWIWRSYLQVFVLQGLILFIIDTPLLLIAATRSQPIDVFCIIGAITWLTGFVFEAVSDRQLQTFKSDPKNQGKIITIGLWAWSRHPNYFGEVLQWWGIAIIALPIHWGFFGFISPITITLLILKVSGVPMLEKQMEKRPGFVEYKRRTSVFIPLPPKK
jgi:steroid 5-alpha reductase family enzyme